MSPHLWLPVWGVAGPQQDAGSTATLPDSAPAGVCVIPALLAILLLQKGTQFSSTSFAEVLLQPVRFFETCEAPLCCVSYIP